jgi:hypothetical protein
VGANGSVWVIGTDAVGGGFGLWHWTGRGWASTPGGAVAIAVDPHGNPWVVNNRHTIYRWTGTAWSLLPGAATDIGVGANGSAWVIGTNAVGGGFGLWHSSGRGWASTPGGALAIAVGPDANPWVVDSRHQILSYGPIPHRFAVATSSNGRYLVDQDGRPFLVNGDAAWNAAWALDAADQATYLADRAAHGYNTIITDLVGSTSLGAQADGANYNGDLPFTGGNFSTPNDAYWSKIDSFFRLSQFYGISVFAIPIDAYTTTSVNVFATMTNAQAATFGSFLGNRYPQWQYPGIVWMFGNDWDADGPPGSGENSTPSASFYQALLTGIRSTGDTRPTTVELGYSESASTDGSAFGPTVSLNAAYSYHPTYEVVLRSRAAADKPVIFIEGAYENALTRYPSAPLDLRKQVGWTMTSGGAGTFYGNDSLWKFGAGWQNQLDTSDVAQRSALYASLDGIKWWTLAPDTGNALVVAGRNQEFTSWSPAKPPNTDDATYGWYVSAARSSDGSLAVIYNPDTTRNRITISSSVLGANPTITAVDPTDGATRNLGWTTTPAMGANAAGDHDWLFIINASPRG